MLNLNVGDLISFDVKNYYVDHLNVFKSKAIVVATTLTKSGKYVYLSFFGNDFLENTLNYEYLKKIAYFNEFTIHTPSVNTKFFPMRVSLTELEGAVSVLPKQINISKTRAIIDF